VEGVAEGRFYCCTVAGSPGTWKPAGIDPLLDGLGYKSWNYNPNSITTNTAPTSQTLYGVLMATVAGISYTGVTLQINTAANGTAPTGFFVGLASAAGNGSAGTMLAQSSNLNGQSMTTPGLIQYAFSAAYVETVTTIRYVLLLQNGAFSVTNPTFFKSGASIGGKTGDVVTAVTAGTGITALQANGNPVANNYAITSNQPFWAALY
jgi:hypothetical protein